MSRISGHEDDDDDTLRHSAKPRLARDADKPTTSNLNPPPPSRVSKPATYHETSPQTLSYPSTQPGSSPTASTPFQKPSLLLTFSYTPEHVQEFTDSALRRFVQPRLGANLKYGYERWIRRPDERGRLDPLLMAWSKIQSSMPADPPPPPMDVVAWRGIITK
jgi:RAT1-interacting protein